MRISNQHGLKTRHEFKYSQPHDEPAHRAAFYGAALAGPFRFAACCIDKKDGWRGLSAEVLHEECAVAIAAGLRSVYIAQEYTMQGRGDGKRSHLRELVIVDDNKDAAFLRVVRRVFSEMKSVLYPDVSLVSKVRFGDSGPDGMIQLADMVCGAVGAHVSPDGDSRWFRMIEARCADLTIYPVPKRNGAEAT